MEAAVELSAATKRYGDVVALDGVSLIVPPRQVLALLGPNGAGKTTAISLMLGLRRPTAGTARLMGRDPRDRRARSRVGVMLQESAVPGTLRVRELVDLFRSYYPNPLPAARVIEMADLADKAEALAATLSGGQRQRLYFGLAVCGDPDVLFLDEPTVGMDVEARRGFWGHMRAFAAAGKTLVLTTHYMEEADALADRVVLIDRGRIRADGSPTAIKARVGARRVSFRYAAAPASGLFDGLPVEALEVSEGSVRFLSHEPETALRALFERGAQIDGLEVVGAALEDALVAIQRGES